MSRRLRPAAELVSDIGSLGFDLQHHSDEDIAEAVAFLRQVNPDMFDWLSTLLGKPQALAAVDPVLLESHSADLVQPETGLVQLAARVYLADDVDELLAALRVRAEGLHAENKELEDEVEDREEVIHNFEASDEQKQIRINELTAELTALRASQETLQAERDAAQAALRQMIETPVAGSGLEEKDPLGG